MSTDIATQKDSPETPTRRGGIETNGINVIDESERKGRSAGLFWPWCASNISVLAVSYGSFVLGFGISLTQALVATVVGAVASFFLVGLVSIAGKRGSAPTLVLSRAAFGRVGNGLPGLVPSSWTPWSATSVPRPPWTSPCTTWPRAGRE